MFSCCVQPASPDAEVVKVDQVETTTGTLAAAEEQAAVSVEMQKKAAEDDAAAKKKEEEEAAAKQKKADEEEAAKKKAADDAAAQANAKEFVVELVMDAGKSPIGVELLKPKFSVKSFRDDGMIAKYNASGAGQKVAIGDVLTSFNGFQKADLLTAIKDAYQKLGAGEKMTLTFSRP
eukprot:TRINITY_DN30725_c0_g1_i1.p2 TRINITY_DN30725_c0_g1~~TRINITY_DN30725_c0_g1_i1.p2  ORF type:complete len:177 (-),score=62.56 TRINITY_DN30725_c0_g1_i1:93-623(-)